MPVLINLKNYLADLERDEKARPANQRREVPNLTELADVAGIHRVPFTRIANGQVKLLNLEVMNKVISEMRRRGFKMDVGDFLLFRDEVIQ